MKTKIKKHCTINKITTEIDAINGRWHGYYIETRDSGVIRYKSKYIDGRQVGLSQWWEENGSRGFVNTLKGRMNGTLIKFYYEK